MTSLLYGYAIEMSNIISHLRADTWSFAASLYLASLRVSAMSRYIVHLFPGARALCGFYSPLGLYLSTCFSRALSVCTPHRRLTSIREIPSYLAGLYRGTPGTQEILVAHSLGGYAALKRLYDEPDTVKKVILMETPLDPLYISPEIHFFLCYTGGIDLVGCPGSLACLPAIKKNQDLLRKIAVIATRRPTFLPIQAYALEGAELHLVDSTHTLLPHSPAVQALIGQLIEREVGGECSLKMAA